MFTAIITAIFSSFASYMVFLAQQRRSKKKLMYEKSIVNLMRLTDENEDGKLSIKYGNETIHSLHAVDVTVSNLSKQRILYEDFHHHIERPFTISLEGQGKIIGARLVEAKPENMVPIDLKEEIIGPPQEKSVEVKPISIGKKQWLKFRLLVGDFQENDQVKVNIHGNFETKESWIYRWTFPSLVVSTSLIFIVFCITILVSDRLPDWFILFYLYSNLFAFCLSAHSIGRLHDMGFVKELRKASKLNSNNYQGK